MAGVGQAEGPLLLVCMRGERGSPGSPSEMSLSLPGSRANQSVRGPRLFPQRLKSEMNLSEQFTYDQPRQHMKKQRHYFTNKVPSSQSYGFSSSHIWMWEMDYKKAERRRIDAFELWC